MSQQPGRLRPTRVTTLIAVAVIGFALSWGTLTVLRRRGSSLPEVQWLSVGVLAFGGLVVCWIAFQTWSTLHRRGRYLDPQRAVNLYVLGRASAVVGALVAGAYLGYLLQYVGDLGFEVADRRSLRSGLGMASGVLLAVGGKLLEHACKAPRPPDEHDEQHPSSTGRE